MEKLKNRKKPGNRDHLCRICFILIFISLIYSFFSHTLVSQLLAPILKFPGTDLTYWVFNILLIPKWISGNPVPALFFDILLFATCLLCIYYPGKRIYSGTFSLLYFIYFIIYNNFGMHHVHSRIGILLLSAPFLAKSETGFEFLWQALRYYVCFIYSSAFCWKLFRGSGFYSQQGILILKKNLTAYLYFNPHSALSNIYYFLIRHPLVPDLIMKTGFIMEGLFVVGFLTRRFDKYLFLLSILLPLGFLFMADALFFELAFLSVVFYKIKREGFQKQPGQFNLALSEEESVSNFQSGK
jgi:hypothetical protein